MTLDEYRQTNRARWDAAAEVHLRPGGYPVEDFVADPSFLSAAVRFDAPRLGDLTGRRVVQPACHIGLDALSLARLGAVVTGTDFSPRAIEAACHLGDRAGLDARFVEVEFYDTPDAVEGEAFDLVYLSDGTLSWLPDIAAWGEVVAALLAPGGRLYVRDVHPMLQAMDDQAGEPLVCDPYFEHAEPLELDSDHSYTGQEISTATRSFEWNHGLGEIVTAVLNAGLTVTGLEEHRFLGWPFWSWMEPDGHGHWVLPEARRDHVPLMFSLTATRPMS